MKRFHRLVAVYSPTSSRAVEYTRKVAPTLKQLAATHEIEFVEISLDKMPYFIAVQTVHEILQDGDVVFGAGGDGVNQVTLQGAFESKRDVVAGFLSLGNANDFATALNGRVKNPTKILNSPTIDFHPLELTINYRIKFYVAAYATLGITTVAVDWLNAEEIRANRKHLAKLSPIAALGTHSLKPLSHAINNLHFPPFRRDNLTHHDDSVGFFLASAAKGILRLSGASNFLTRDDFFFHFDNVRKKSPGKSWFGKSLIAGRWVTFGLPGVISDWEKLEFLHPADMTIHIGGDTVELAQIKTITAERTKHSIKIFAPRKKY